MSDTLSVSLTGSAVLIAEWEKVETSIKETESEIKFELGQNYPNPFNPETKIKFQIPLYGRTTLRLFDLLGKEVSLLLDEVLDRGIHFVDFNASSLPSGIYFYQLKSGSYSITKKMILLK